MGSRSPVAPAEWRAQLDLAARYPDAIIPVFGLHPWWVAAHGEEECNTALAALREALPKASAAGEMGLDFGPRTQSESHPRQERIFIEQLKLSSLMGLPRVLHIVQAHERALLFLTARPPHPADGTGSDAGIVHAFTGSFEVAQKYIKLGYSISIGCKIARTKGFETLKRAVVRLPLDRWVIESDAPDQPPPRYEGGQNEPDSIVDVAAALGRILGMEQSAVLENSTRNLVRIFRLPLCKVNSANL